MSSVTVVATVEADYNPPRVRLDVTDTGTPAITTVTVTRLNPDGVSEIVRTIDGGPLTLTTSGSNRVGLLYDYEMPLGLPVTYQTVGSPVQYGPVQVDSSQVWLVHPGVPAISMPITVQSIGERTTAVTRGVFFPLGRATPVVQTDGARKYASFDLKVLTFTYDELAALRTLLDDASTLFLNVPAGKNWGFSWSYVNIADVTETRIGGVASDPMRSWSLPMTLVFRPGGGTQATRTYADVLADNATLGALTGRYSSFFNLLAGP